MERLKMMKEQLMSAVQSELGRLDQTDAKELGEVVDMIKDLSEAVYYCTIVKSMEESEKENKKEYPRVEYRYYPMPMNYEQGGNSGGSHNYTEYRDMDRGMGRMYYEGDNSGGNQGGGSRGYQDGNRQSSGESRNYPIEIRDYREGQSPLTRKTYMERKMLGGDKAAQMKELEKYMQELSHDITEMVGDASPEEKQMLKQKLQTLATKIV